MFKIRLLLAVLATWMVLGSAAQILAVASKGGWDSTIILRGSERTAVKSIPIENRPNRPLHVYGNTIRRMDHRGATRR